MPAESIVSVLLILAATSLASSDRVPSSEKEKPTQHERMVQQYLGEQRQDLAIFELK